MQSTSKKNNYFIGTLSGTSMDAIDASIYKITNKIKLVDSISFKMPEDLKAKLFSLSKSKKNLFQNPTKTLKQADDEFTRITVKTIKRLIKKSGLCSSDITAIGSHGQTIQHSPFSKKPYSLQIGSPDLIAIQTGITTIGNFRQTNIINGGSGAPLTPAFHQKFLRNKKQNRVIINIGGISNLTLLLKNQKIVGWDSGPGNCLIDQSIKFLSKGENSFDKNGRWGKKGDLKKLDKLINEFLSREYFHRKPPKSDSTENYNFSEIYSREIQISKFDWISAMTEITAKSIFHSLKENCNAKELGIYLCGGGSKNLFLMDLIKSKLPKKWKLYTTKALGIDPMLVETSTFAWLAKQRIENRKIDLRSSTNAEISLTGEIFKS